MFGQFKINYLYNSTTIFISTQLGLNHSKKSYSYISTHLANALDVNL